MCFKKTMQDMYSLLSRIMKDLNKVERGNKAAAQRVRTGTIKFEKVSKCFRKESITEEKSGSFKKKKKG